MELSRELGAPGWSRAASLPFASTRGYHAVLGNTANGPVLSVKGAPEVLLPRCAATRRGDQVTALDDAARSVLERHVERLAREGLRVLAVAERAASGRADLDDERVERLELVGFVTVSDVAALVGHGCSIARLQHAGISVVMLTGDHPSTAAAIASELGLLDGRVVSGTDLDVLDDGQLDALVDETVVFARVTPVHKVRIVQAFQRRGRTVAMAGDGANDAQAIRLADIGIVFGPRATSAARGAADLVIADDRVETLITSIIEGRAMWASVRDALALLLGGNLGEVIFTTGATLVSGRSPLNARQLLAVNLLTDLAPAMAIALQPPLSRDVDLRREGPDTSLGGRLVRDVALRAAATSAGAGRRVDDREIHRNTCSRPNGRARGPRRYPARTDDRDRPPQPPRARQRSRLDRRAHGHRANTGPQPLLRLPSARTPRLDDRGGRGNRGDGRRGRRRLPPRPRRPRQRPTSSPHAHEAAVDVDLTGDAAVPGLPPSSPADQRHLFTPRSSRCCRRATDADDHRRRCSSH